jgi:hypothetical protein
MVKSTLSAAANSAPALVVASEDQVADLMQIAGSTLHRAPGLGLPSCKTPVLMHKSFPLPNIKAYAKVGENVETMRGFYRRFVVASRDVMRSVDIAAVIEEMHLIDCHFSLVIRQLARDP